MARRDDKQVTEALQAIRKLVEMSEDKMGKGDDIVTLDHVVWRNPIKDEDEIIDDSADIQEPIYQTSQPSKAAANGLTPSSDQSAVSDHETEADAQDRARPITQTSPIAASGVVTARELDGLARKPLEMSQIVRKREPVAASMPTPPRTTEPAITSSPARTENQPTAEPSALPPANPQIEATSPITELTQPLGRRGGGYYTGLPRNQSVPDMMVRPAIEAAKPEPNIAPTEPRDALVSERDHIDDKPSVNASKNEAFADDDFSFHIAETPMSRLSFEPIAAEASGEMPHVIQPDIQVPIAQPAVANPAEEVQKMFAPEPESQSDEVTAYSETEDNFDEPISHPTLHIVSDSSLDEEEDDAPGFSGAVRGALRSIIKEQVSSWLEGNMTDLIEEALTSPQKRPKSSRKPSSKSKG